MELFKASRQWAKRPADERFGSLQEMYEACRGYFESAHESRTQYSNLRVEADGGEVVLTGKSEQRARLTHWSFGQLSKMVNAPAEYLRALPATLAVQNLNHGLKERGDNALGNQEAQLLLHKNGSLVLRAITTERYTRIWNHDIINRLQGLEAQGWQVPPARPVREGQLGTRPATQKDVLRLGKGSGLEIKVGDPIAPAGLYASDHDMFTFLVDEQHRIEDGTPEGLGRGFFVENSEVGGSAFKITAFLYRYVCGNHIVWGAEGVRLVSLKHIGAVNTRAWVQLAAEVKNYANDSASDLEAKIKSTKQYQIAGTKDEVLDKLFGMKSLLIPRKTLEASYEMAEKYSDVDGSPRSAWGFAQGMTRISQLGDYMDERTKIDRAAGKILEMVF